MRDSNRHTYRLVLKDKEDVVHMIEFEGDGPEAVLLFAERHCNGEVCEVFEDGRPLGLIRRSGGGDYWTVCPATPMQSAPT